MDEGQWKLGGKRKAYGLHLSFVDDLQENIFMNVDAYIGALHVRYLDEGMGKPVG